jgi:cysteine-rich repeat protein
VRSAALLALLLHGCVAPLPPCSDGVCGVPPDLGDDGSGSGTSATGDGSAPGPDPTADTTAPAGPVCGDGVLEGAEVCDDANVVDGDGCNADCDVSLRMLDFVAFDGGELGRDIGLDLGVDDEGDIVVVGAFALGGLDTAFVQGFDAQLAERFVHVHDTGMTMTMGTSRARSVAVNEAGFAAVVGDLEVDGASDVLLLFHDAEGAQSWSATFDGPDALADHGNAILFDPFGQLYAAGQTTRTSGDRAALLLQYSPDGVKIGDTVLDAPPGSALDPLALAYAVPSRLVFAGMETGPMSAEIVVSAIDLDPFAGDSVHAGDPVQGARASGVAVDGDGEIIAVGMDSGRAWAAKYTTGLATVWMIDFNLVGDPRELYDVVVVPEDDSFYVVGDVDLPNTDNDVFVAHYDLDGNELARAVHDLGSLEDSARGLARAPDGTLLVTGETETPAGYDAFVLRLSP